MKQVMVWDQATRIFHWALVVLIIAAWYTIENRMIDVHQLIGHALIGLVIFRLVWGVIGSSTAQFKNFIRNPFSALTYLKASLKLTSPHATGHNPAGGWMVVVMLLVIGFQLISGLLANDDLGFSGAFSDYVSKALSDTFTQLHALNFTLLLVLIWLHLVAVFFYVMVKNEHLIRAMLTGKKLQSQVNPDEKITLKPIYQGLICLILSIVLGYWLLQ